ncbi:GNAT family N-acetyltransferase [Salinibacterium sp. UTAS2018]|uniref:GNAT family N-acetyltransferase n=1 Tax=unclassified Salinibacterium TaxID=2632331 RepID=UPI0010097FB4|nr:MULTISPECIES: GNAT family N-acetyltransferase [unclassified Salinibacterium]MBH0008367.1 GNAT family N-acetyltransferase [Salinibacterium sp. SWN1162]QAV70321.1 GNAT family N-acetyltransferase [Salinibacterium sp. UTAS2018]
MRTPEFTIRRTDADDWREVRTLRLEMLADTPMGFAERLDSARSATEADWRFRAVRGQNPRGIAIAAITTDGRWIGTMGGYVPDATTGPLLVGVYVTPDFRGRKAGVTDALLSTIEEWAATYGSTLTLGVHEDNARARAAYEGRGYVLTRHSVPYILDKSRRELEMIKQL